MSQETRDLRRIGDLIEAMDANHLGRFSTYRWAIEHGLDARAASALARQDALSSTALYEHSRLYQRDLDKVATAITINTRRQLNERTLMLARLVNKEAITAAVLAQVLPQIPKPPVNPFTPLPSPSPVPSNATPVLISGNTNDGPSGPAFTTIGTLPGPRIMENFSLQVMGQDSAGNSAPFRVDASFKNVGGVITQVGTVGGVVTALGDDSAVSAATVQVIVVNNVPTVQVKGKASGAMSWVVSGFGYQM